MYVSINEDNIIRAASKTPIYLQGQTTLKIQSVDQHSDLIGKTLKIGDLADNSKLRIAMVCNWGDRCGIATYSKLLVDALRQQVAEVKVFAECREGIEPENGVSYNWKRGESMVSPIQEILAWKPDIIHVQHEFGIFPKATHFLKMLELLAPHPYVITTHSVYEHLDKSVCSACIKNTIVHSEEASRALERLGHLNPVHVIHHGCVVYPDTSELWNIFQNDYTIVQFGFGFHYKGVDQAVDAIGHLKQNDSKFKDIFYCYLSSENPHTRLTHQEYYGYLKKKVVENGLEENVVILRGFLSEKIIRNFLRTAKLAIFPYRNDPNNCVYGASGAIRNAMASGIPLIGSKSHLFDDLDGVVPRVDDHLELAAEIDKIFSNGDYRRSLIEKNLAFVNENDWPQTASKHVQVYRSILDSFESQTIRVSQLDG